MWTSEERGGYRQLASYLCHNDDACIGLYFIHHVGYEGRYIHTQVQVSLDHKQHEFAAYRPDAKDVGFFFSYNKEEVAQTNFLSEQFPTIITTDHWELLSAGYFKYLLRLYLATCYGIVH